ncbi:calcium-binding mitochondrial carrier protein Aralar1 [Apiospora marii]|uniref:Calcium-binding mitochondrial carrier protein Aralar1 n=1 Tax=Apiospora marii TaxID=335849 RepID=A0ABR1R4L9_9PEZI
MIRKLLTFPGPLSSIRYVTVSGLMGSMVAVRAPARPQAEILIHEFLRVLEGLQLEELAVNASLGCLYFERLRGGHALQRRRWSRLAWMPSLCGELYMGEEEFVNAIAPHDEDYGKIKREQYGLLSRVADRKSTGKLRQGALPGRRRHLGQRHEPAFRPRVPNPQEAVESYHDWIQSRNEDIAPGSNDQKLDMLSPDTRRSASAPTESSHISAWTRRSANATTESSHISAYRQLSPDYG